MRLRDWRLRLISRDGGTWFTRIFRDAFPMKYGISSRLGKTRRQERRIMDTSESQKQLELSIFGTRDLVRNCVYKVNELSPLKSTCTASTIYAMRSLRDWIKILDNELKL